MSEPVRECGGKEVTPPCTPERRSHIHAVVPVEAHTRARIMALQSGLSFRSYLAQLLMTAEPIGQVAVETPAKPSTDTAEGIAVQEGGIG